MLISITSQIVMAGANQCSGLKEVVLLFVVKEVNREVSGKCKLATRMLWYPTRDGIRSDLLIPPSAQSLGKFKSQEKHWILWLATKEPKGVRHLDPIEIGLSTGVIEWISPACITQEIRLDDVMVISGTYSLWNSGPFENPGSIWKSTITES